MNKIKLMYDVVKTMKEKELINGNLTVEGTKDQVQFVRFANEFQRNLLTGDVKAKISTQLDVEGKKVKHESSTEFTLNHNRQGMFHHFGMHMHEHHRLHHSGQGHSFKDKLTVLAFVFEKGLPWQNAAWSGAGTTQAPLPRPSFPDNEREQYRFDGAVKQNERGRRNNPLSRWGANRRT